MKSLWKSLASVKLAIFLLILITLASILGTLIPQHRSPAEYAAHYGQLSRLLINLEFTRLYQSAWYRGLLLLFGLNTIICTLTRLSPKLKRAFNPSLKADTKKLQALKIHSSLKRKSDLDQVKSEILKTTRRFWYRTRELREENRIFLLSRKKTAGIFGSDVVHLGILIILLGGIISGTAGFRQSFNISEGETLSIPKADFALRLDKFETEFYPSGAVKDWKSTLTVIDNGEERLTRTIEVNHPLSYRGFVFYQSRYGWDWENPELELRIKKPGEAENPITIRLHVGEKATLGDGDTEFHLLRFIPDFIIGENNQVATRSLDPNNPAAYVEGRREGESIFSGWIFSKYPDFSRMHSDQEQPYTVEFTDLQAAQYSGIQMAKDPGVLWIWIGCSLLMLGLMLAFYWPPREIKWHLSQSSDRVDIFAGGVSVKSKEAFQNEFEKIITALGRTK